MAMTPGQRLTLPRRTLAGSTSAVRGARFGGGGGEVEGSSVVGGAKASIRAGFTRAVYGVTFDHQPWAQFTYPNNWLLPKDPSQASEKDTFASLGTRCEVRQADEGWPVTRAPGVGVGGWRIVCGLVVGVMLLNTLGLW